MDALTRRFVSAIAAGDTPAMHRLRVTTDEHNTITWPELPASRLNHPVDFAWLNIDSRSVRDAACIVETLGGVTYDVVGSCRDGVTAYQTFRVHGDCWVTLHRHGQRFDAKLFGCVVAMDGRFKVIGIRTD